MTLASSRTFAIASRRFVASTLSSWFARATIALPVPRERRAAARLEMGRTFSTERKSWDAVEDVDLDSVAYGFMASQALFSALELNVFDVIAKVGEAGATIAQINDGCGIQAPRLQTLVTSLTAIGCLRRTADGHYHLSPNTSKFMVTTSRQYYGNYLKYQVGRQFYHTMGTLSDVMRTGEAPNYASWFADPEVAAQYTTAQHNGSVATAKYLLKKKLSLEGARDMLDVGGGSGAFSYVFVEATPGLKSTVLELPEVCKTGNTIREQQTADVRERVSFMPLDASLPDWPVSEAAFDVVLMSYISGSVPAEIITSLYGNAHKALRPGGRLVVHDFMVDDSLDGPALGALWGLQHVTVNASGLGLSPSEVAIRMTKSGFASDAIETMEMIHGMTKLLVAQKASSRL